MMGWVPTRVACGERDVFGPDLRAAREDGVGAEVDMTCFFGGGLERVKERCEGKEEIVFFSVRS